MLATMDLRTPVLTLSVALVLACTDDNKAEGTDVGDTGESMSSETSTSSEASTGEDSSSETSTSTSSESSDSSGSETAGTTGGDVVECEDWQVVHPEWIFCDDFEDQGPLVADGRYFEHDDNAGDFVAVEGVGFGESRAMQVSFQAGEVGAGSLELGFGRNPNAYMNKGIRPNEDFREIWYRMYLKNQAGWTGDPAKLSRATSFSSADDWSQAMIAHLWGDGNEHLLVDPVSCVENGQVVCQGYNDFANMSWLGNQSGVSAIFSTAESGQWRCIEAHVRLDDPGLSNGVHEFWIDGQLEASREGLTFVGDYADHGINAVFFENYWNDGSSQDQQRWFDNIVVSTAPIGCL